MSESEQAPRWATSRGAGRTFERGFRWLCAGAILLPIALLVVGLIDLASFGLAGRDAALWAALWADGIAPALRDSVALVSLTAVVALPLGVGAAIYLEEYDDGGFVARLIEFNIDNLSGVPSVIYGLLGLELFVRGLGLGAGLLASALTLALVVIPLVIIATRTALREVPASLREAGLSLGATRWQVVRRVVLPLALPRILTGAMWAIARALGEAAPLLVLGALAYASVDQSSFAPLPVRIFDWLAQPREAAAGICTLLLALLLLDVLAIVLRNRVAGRGGLK